MSNGNIQNDYRERINKVLAYIEEHLGEKLDLETLASVSCFSLYHFHRIIRAHLNESLGSYIIRQRLQTAAMLLEHSKKSISEIAYDIGYETPSSLSKAFKSRFGCSPKDFREGRCKLKRLDQKLLFNLKETNMSLKPEIRQIDSHQIIYVRAVGAYKNVGSAWGSVCEFAGRKGLLGPQSLMFGLSYDDPDHTEESKLRYDACIVIDNDIKPEGEVGVKTTYGGKYAVFRHEGSYENLSRSYNDIFRNWLPESGFEVADAPPMEIYLNDPEKVKPEELRTEICIPVK